MKERLLTIWQNVKEKTATLSGKTKKLIIGGVVFCILLSVGVAVWLNTRPYEVLFSELSSEEASEIIGKLQEDGVSYKYQDDGTILVPAEQEEALKAQLVYEGYPNSGFTYDLFTENVSLTSTESEKAHYQLLNLQERMGATIELFPNIKDAKVTIALGENSRYVLNDKNKQEATVSATLITDNGQLIGEDEVRAIQRLMSKSIQGVDFENVAVICNGQDVTVEEEGKSQTLASELKLSLEKDIENKIRKEISNLLLPIYGQGHFQVSVKAEVDVNKKLREIINYSAENPDKNTGVISNENTGWEINRDDAANGGVPGTETNSDIPVYTQIMSDGSENYIGATGDIHYLVDQLKEQTEVQAGDLTDLSVAVIIDGQTLGGLTRDELISLVAKAAGIRQEVQNEKIEVLNAPFFNEVVEQPEQKTFQIAGFVLTQEQVMLIAAAAAGVLLLLIILIVGLLRRKKKKRLAEEAAEAERIAAEEAAMQEAELQRLKEEALLRNEAVARQMGQVADMEGWDAMDFNEDLLNLKNERGMELKNKIRGFTEENPEIVAQLLKRWLKGDEQDG